MQKAEEGLVFRLAVLSRLLLVALIVIWRSLFPPYDSSAQLNPSCLSPLSTAGNPSPSDAADRVLWPWVGAAIEGSVVWDSVYFVRIAECGYEYEQTYAFLPLLPISTAFLSTSVFAPLIPMIGYRAVLGLSGYVVNNLAFVLAAVYFYKLSILILKDSKASLLASILFCFNPASVFYSSIYSESLYALSSLCGIFYLFSDSNTVAMLLLGLSGAARSNGAINAGYFCFKALCQAYDAIAQKRTIRHAVQDIIGGFASSICLFVPFIVFQTYGYYNICVSAASDGLSPWCRSRVPNLYGYLQRHYWGVGFLRYFQVKQLPNFLLASPILAIAIASIIYYSSLLQQSLRVKSRKASNFMAYPLGDSRTRIFSSSLNYSSSSKEFKALVIISEHISWYPGTGYSIGEMEVLLIHFLKYSVYVSCMIKKFFCSETGNLIYQKQKNENKAKTSENFYNKLDSFIEVNQGYCSILVLPFILHLGFMTFMALFVMHVQVATRFLSASPPIYWFASYMMLSPGKTSRRFSYLICSYLIAYILLGTLLFSNFYPFT